MTKPLVFLINLLCWFYAINSAQAESIKVVTEHLPPIQIVENSKVVGGISTEVVKLMLAKTGSDSDIIATNWARAYHMAVNQENVMIYSITRTSDRESLFKWVGAVASFNNYLWRLKSRTDIDIKRIKEAKHFRIAVPRDDMQHDELKGLGFNEQHHLVVTSNYHRSVLLVLRGRADLVVGNRLFLSHMLHQHNKHISAVQPVFELAPSTLYIAFGNKTSDAVVAKYSQALIEVKQGKQYLSLMKKWHLRHAGF